MYCCGENFSGWLISMVGLSRPFWDAYMRKKEGDREKTERRNASKAEEQRERRYMEKRK